MMPDPAAFLAPRSRIAVLTCEPVGVLDYLAPEDGVRQGALVLVPLGPRRVLGLVWGEGRGDFDLAKLRPVFDRKHGSVTAGNASPLTDGGSAVLLMSEERAKGDGLEPMGFVRSYAFSGLDPAGQLLQGPAYAAPMALDRAGITMADIDLMEMHEAFAAQVLSNLQALSSQKFAEEELGRSQAVGHPDLDVINVMGGSIAIGHPFGATGGRITTTLLNEMKRRDVELGLITVCAAGGLGFAMVVERG